MGNGDARASRGYRYLSEIAPADAAFEAFGGTLEELFWAAAEATLGVMIEDVEKIDGLIERQVVLANQALDLLLFDWLHEIIFYKDAESLLLRPRGLRIETGAGEQRLSGRLAGEPLDPSRHQPLLDVKAVTLHRLEVRETPSGWYATVVLDI